MQSEASGEEDGPIEPGIARFVQAILDGSARHPDPGERTYPERRAIAEQVRAPWVDGGPAMLRREEIVVPFDGRTVRIRLLSATDGDGPRPALIYLHGGGFVLFSLDTHDRLMREYAAAGDVIVIGVDYSLSPEARYPTALEEVVAVVDWLSARASALGIDPARIAIGGDSAGANLALAAALALRDRGHGDRLAGLLLNYGFFDADSATRSHKLHGGPGQMLTSAELAAYLDDYFAPGASRNDPLALPALATFGGLPPSFHVIASHDPLADGDRAVAAAMAAAGNAVEAKVYQGATHSFLEAMSVSPLARQAIADSAEWLRRTLAPQPAAAL